MIEITYPTADQLREQRVEQRMAPAAAARIQQDGKTTGALIRERALEDAAELDDFVEMVAAHFRCPSLAADQTRIRLRSAFQELRSLARRLDAEADRRGAPIGSPAGRDGSGRFTRGG